MKEKSQFGDGNFITSHNFASPQKLRSLLLLSVEFISVLNVKEGRVRDGLPCQQASTTFTGAGATTGRACLRGLHSICFIRDSVCNLCWGGDGQSHRATHCFIVYNEEQCFRMFVSFVPIC